VIILRLTEGEVVLLTLGGIVVVEGGMVVEAEED
jgi:hypothetical protein